MTMLKFAYYALSSAFIAGGVLGLVYYIFDVELKTIIALYVVFGIIDAFSNIVLYT